MFHIGYAIQLVHSVLIYMLDEKGEKSMRVALYFDTHKIAHLSLKLLSFCVLVVKLC